MSVPQQCETMLNNFVKAINLFEEKGGYLGARPLRTGNRQHGGSLTVLASDNHDRGSSMRVELSIQEISGLRNEAIRIVKSPTLAHTSMIDGGVRLPHLCDKEGSCYPITTPVPPGK